MNTPIFIVGCPHSGTSVMLAILGSHPNIWPVPGESRLFLEQHDPHHIALTTFGWYQAAIADGRQRWAEKTARHIYNLKVIRDRYPQAKIIAMLRDGRDVFCSHLERGLGADESIQLWKSACQVIRHENLFTVRYEKLVTEPEATVRDICKYLGEPFVPEMLKTEGRDREWYVGTAFREHRNEQINRPLYDGRRDWEGVDLTQFYREAQGLLLDMGYEVPLPPPAQTVRRPAYLYG